MNSEPVKTEFDDNALELNYNDAKERFPKIIEFFRLVHEYQNAPNYFVPTDGSQVYPNTLYKQNDVTTDWYGSWRKIVDAFSGIDQTIQELLIYYNKQVKSGTIVLTDSDFKPGPNGGIYFNSPDNEYWNYYRNVAFPYRGWGRFTNQTRDALLNLEPAIMTAMKKFSDENGDSFEEITQARIDKDLLTKQIGSLTGNEFFGLLGRFLKKNNLKVVNDV